MAGPVPFRIRSLRQGIRSLYEKKVRAARPAFLVTPGPSRADGCRAICGAVADAYVRLRASAALAGWRAATAARTGGREAGRRPASFWRDLRRGWQNARLLRFLRSSGRYREPVANPGLRISLGRDAGQPHRGRVEYGLR